MIKDKLKNSIFGILKQTTICFFFLFRIYIYISRLIRYNNFVEKPNIPEKCCLVVASRKNQDEEGGRGGHEAKLCKEKQSPISI